MVKQMLLASENAKPNPPCRFPNPHPPGVMREGSATFAVYEFLTQNPGRCYNHSQIVAATGRSVKSVDFGLAFLRKYDRIECFPDRRNARYFLYRLKIVGEVNEQGK